MQQKKILIVDDEQDLCDILLFNLHAAGYQADYALSAEEALTKDLPSHADQPTKRTSCLGSAFV